MSDEPKESPGEKLAKPAEPTRVEQAFEAMGKLADQRPETLMQVLSMSAVGQMANPLHQKMTPEHVTQVLDLATKHDEREFELQRQKYAGDLAERGSHRVFTFWAFVVLVVLVGFVMVLFKDQPTILVPVLTGLGGLFGGFLGGMGYGSRTRKK